MTETHFDVVVIGGGPGGYVAAIRAAQLGLKTACIDKRTAWGGTCLNVGCIPSKALLHSSHKFQEAKDHLGDHGVRLGQVELDLGTMMARKDKVVRDLTRGIEFLFRKNDVTAITGTGRILKQGVVEVTDGDSTRTCSAEHLLIATGSESTALPGVEIDEQQILSSTGALSLNEVPEHLIVIGGGYIGLELGSVWSRLGSAVTVVEFFDRIVPGMDTEIALQLQRALKRQGMAFRLGTRVVEARIEPDHVTLGVEPAEGGDQDVIQGDRVLVAIGRRPFTDGLGLEEIGVACDEQGAIRVDEHYRTNVDGIYAIGDVISGPMLAHKAEEEAIACVERIAGHVASVNYAAIPAVVYTWPEVASVGCTEEDIKAEGASFKVGRFPFSANSRARTSGESEGLVKIVSDEQTDRVRGVHIIGPEAGTMIAELVLAMEFGASSEDIARTCHAHPTLNEAVKEAALAVGGAPIHS